jgi:hypothetical protein
MRLSFAKVLLKKFKALFSPNCNESSTCRLNLIAVGRDVPHFIPEIPSTFLRIRLDPDADSEINSDIHRFIEVKVNELSKYRQHPEPLHVHVKKVFLNGAKGSFLWVGIVAKELRKYKATEIENALELSPSGLEELDTRMLLQIDVDRRDTTAKILRWVIMAARPLTLSKLCAMPALLQFNYELPVLAAKLCQLAMSFHQKPGPKLMTTVSVEVLGYKKARKQAYRAPRRIQATLGLIEYCFNKLQH